MIIHFTDQSTSDGEIVTWHWIFGDGHEGDGPNPSHTYEEPGVYVVCLVIHDDNGCVSDVCHEVVVEAPPMGECHAQFTWEQPDPELLIIHFTDQSTSDGSYNFV